MTIARPSGPVGQLPPNRAVVSVRGTDARPFLQGVVSNDIDKVTPDRAIWAAFLTPQGKYLFDFFVMQAPDASPDAPDTLLLDCEADRRDDLVRRLSRYRLRSKVSVAPDDDLVVALVFGEGAAAALGLDDRPGAAHAFGGGIACVDPRLAAAGVRAVLPRDGAAAALEAAGIPLTADDGYERLRLSLGLPDGSRDLEIEKTILLEAGFHELHGIDWKKGCYMGQELTARTYYRGLVKKRLIPVAVAGPTPAPGTPVTAPDGQEVGEMRSATGDLGLAVLRLAALDGDHTLAAGDAAITPRIPDWMRLQPGARADDAAE